MVVVHVGEQNGVYPAEEAFVRPDGTAADKADPVSEYGIREDPHTVHFDESRCVADVRDAWCHDD
jgi:hypothetical protein